MLKDRFYWAALQQIPGIGLRNLRKLYDNFPSGKDVWMATEKELLAVPKLSEELVEGIIYHRRLLEPKKLASDLLRKKVKVIKLGDPEYPHNLAQIAYPPVILYLKGSFPLTELPLLAVVGSRRATPYGITVCRTLCEELARLGWGVVSGMARGVDTAAHEGVLQENGYTLAVLGCGIDICYPRENYNLMKKIACKGCLLTEFPLGARPEARNFPIRNRIISGCSLGILVIEAEEKSGALITAGFGLEQGREVFAVPGPITSSKSKGCHLLIKQGAKLVATIDDIFEEFPYLTTSTGSFAAKKESEAQLTKKEKAIFQQLSLEPLHVDEIAAVSGYSAAETSSVLMNLQLKGVVRQLPGSYYVWARIPEEAKK